MERLFRHFGLSCTDSPTVTKRLSVRNEGHRHRPSQLSRNTCRALAASGDKVGFSHRIFVMCRDEGVSFVSHIRFLGFAEITARVIVM